MKKIKLIIKKIIKYIFGLVPKKKNKIIFESHSDFCDSSRVLYDYLKQYKGYKFVWFVDNTSDFKNKNFKNTIFLDINKKRSLRNLFHVITSKYIFYTHRSIYWQDINKQVVINLTHGVGIKNSKGKLEEDDKFSKVLSTSDNFVDITIDQYNTTRDKVLVMGLPRNDLLFNKSKLNLPFDIEKYDKVILWLPTFRKHRKASYAEYENHKTIPVFDSKGLEELNDKLNTYNYLLIIKFHPAQDLTGFNFNNYENIITMTNKELDKNDIQLYDFLRVADVLLTDYSSIGNDYMLLDRPIGYVIDDVNEFENGRGFCIEDYMDYLPGEKIYNKEDFYKYLDVIASGKDNYKEQRNKVKLSYHKYLDGNYCKKLVEYLGLQERK